MIYQGYFYFARKESQTSKEREMTKGFPIKLISFFMAINILLSACAGAQNENDGEVKITSNGYICPVPEIFVEVASSELNIFVRAESIPSEMVECFSLMYDVKINLYKFSSDEELFVKISMGGIDYDLVQPSGRIVPLMLSAGKLQELDHDRLSVFGNLDPNYLDLNFDPGNRYTIPYSAGSYGILVNTEEIQTPPASWADLWNSSYLQRMIVPDDARAVIGMTLLELGYDINTTDRVRLQAARDRLFELAPNIQIFDSESPRASLLTGKVDLGIIYSTEAYFIQQEDSAFQYIYPSEGAILWQNNWAIPANAAHTDAAYAWLNYTMQRNVFWLTMREPQGAIPNLSALEFSRTNKNKIYEAYMRSPIINMPLDVIKNGHHILDVGETTPLYDNIWVEIKGE